MHAIMCSDNRGCGHRPSASWEATCPCANACKLRVPERQPQVTEECSLPLSSLSPHSLSLSLLQKLKRAASHPLCVQSLALARECWRLGGVSPILSAFHVLADTHPWIKLT